MLAADYTDDQPQSVNYAYPNGERHVPLGLAVHQEAYAWTLPRRRRRRQGGRGSPASRPADARRRLHRRPAAVRELRLPERRASRAARARGPPGGLRVDAAETTTATAGWTRQSCFPPSRCSPPTTPTTSRSP